VVGDHLRRRERVVAGRGWRVGDEQHRVAERERAAGRGVDAELGVHAADDELPRPARLEQVLQRRAEERVRRGLAHPQVIGLDIEARRQLPLGAAVPQLAGRGLVLHEDHRRRRCVPRVAA
jgi:hypothetical protein